MSHYSRFFFLLAAGLILTTALTAHPVGAQQTYSRPAPGTVRVIAKKIRDDAERVEWQWTILSERYWSNMQSESNGELELSGGDPTLRPDGVNQYDLNIQTRAGKDHDNKPRLFLETRTYQHAVVFHGPNGISVSLKDNNSKGGGENPLKKAVAANKAARALFQGDKTFTLPVKLPLYERTFGLDGTGKVTRQISYLILAK